ncbi:unnamed protein product [Prorocentrum cordatum]|uniref:Uncharacterized protein n=1 Tax=Prorocentrum cordatum TaxID=2364126 RepID=A0ABN9RZP9_9DINO|nr:unnamed protein product [Polarella glacialis]
MASAAARVRQDRIRKLQTPSSARAVGGLKSKARLAVVQEETDDSDMLANWSQIGDPWVDNELQHIDYTAESLSPIECVGLNLLAVLQVVVTTRLLKQLAPGASSIVDIDKDRDKDANGECIHLISARRRGGNQFGTFVHRFICMKRLELHKRTKEEIQTQRLIKKEEKELAQRIEKEMKLEMCEPRKSSPPPMAWKAEGVDLNKLLAHMRTSNIENIKIESDDDLEETSIQSQIDELKRAMTDQQNQGTNEQLVELTRMMALLVQNQSQALGSDSR